MPWTDWGNYWATRDNASKSFFATKNLRGINGSLIDLEYERVELIKFNLFDNSGTYQQYVNGRERRRTAPRSRRGREMRLPPSQSRAIAAVGGAGASSYARASSFATARSPASATTSRIR